MSNLSLILSGLPGPSWLQNAALDDRVRWGLTAAYLTVLALVSIYGLHRYWLVWLFYKSRKNEPVPQARFSPLPRLTVQLPMFNEARVAQRIIDAAIAMDYPHDRIQVQVLDDSTDASARVSRERCEYWAARGRDIQYIHRDNRTGYKAGALENGLATATGEIIAIFDADFVPTPYFLHDTIHYFTDAKVGMVQTRWDHLNRDSSVLTRSQAIFLDGHFVIEHTARNRTARWINFNGTAGLWRKSTIVDAGGWQHDTLTEDVDLSYRAQLKGWRFIFLPWVGCPAELPPEINAFKSQQHRWTKGSIQTARKLLPTLLGSKVSWAVKMEAFFHLTSPMCYLYITLMALLFYPAIYVNMAPFEEGSIGGLLLGVSLFALGTVSASAFYIVSQRAQKRSVVSTVAQLPILMGIGIGIAINNARGCIEALIGHQSPFVRTPKYNPGAGKEIEALPADEDTTVLESATSGVMEAQVNRPWVLRMPSPKLWTSLLEIGMGFYMVGCILISMDVTRTFISTPFLMIFAAGYFYVGLTSLWEQVRGWRWGVRLQPA